MKTLSMYKTIDISTIKGIKYGERLQRQGWVITSVGFSTIWMKRPELIPAR